MVAFQDEPGREVNERQSPDDRVNDSKNKAPSRDNHPRSNDAEYLPAPLVDSPTIDSQPRQQRTRSIVEEPIVIDSEPELMEGEYHELACDEFVSGSSEYDPCDLGTYHASHHLPLDCPWQLRNVIDLRRYEFFAGTQSFSGPMNFQSDSSRTATGGSFGVHQGIQWTSPMPWIFQGWFTGQFGLRGTQSHFQDSTFSQDGRNQLFLTVGAFRRVDYGLQGGLVVDYPKERWYYRTSLTQLRGELSFRTLRGSEFGFAFATGIEDKFIEENFDSGVPNQVNSTIAPMDTFRFFYRFHPMGSKRTSTTIASGFTDDRHFLAEGTLETVLTRQLGLRVQALYVLPNSDIATDRFEQESWAMGISLVYTPGRGFATGLGYEQAMLSVADNSSFLVGRVP